MPGTCKYLSPGNGVPNKNCRTTKFLHRFKEQDICLVLLTIFPNQDLILAEGSSKFETPMHEFMC